MGFQPALSLSSCPRSDSVISYRRRRLWLLKGLEKTASISPRNLVRNLDHTRDWNFVKVPTIARPQAYRLRKGRTNIRVKRELSFQTLTNESLSRAVSQSAEIQWGRSRPNPHIVEAAIQIRKSHQKVWKIGTSGGLTSILETKSKPPASKSNSTSLQLKLRTR